MKHNLAIVLKIKLIQVEWNKLIIELLTKMRVLLNRYVWLPRCKQFIEREKQLEIIGKVNEIRKSY